MARQTRIDAPGTVHQIIARGIERGQVVRYDQDRDCSPMCLGALIVETKTKFFAWALIPIYIHLKPLRAGLVKGADTDTRYALAATGMDAVRWLALPSFRGCVVYFLLNYKGMSISHNALEFL